LGFREGMNYTYTYFTLFPLPFYFPEPTEFSDTDNEDMCLFSSITYYPREHFDLASGKGKTNLLVQFNHSTPLAGGSYIVIVVLSRPNSN
jgi:hypothetical protein